MDEAKQMFVSVWNMLEIPGSKFHEKHKKTIFKYLDNSFLDRERNNRKLSSICFPTFGMGITQLIVK